MSIHAVVNRKMKTKKGKGFSKAELKNAELSVNEALKALRNKEKRTKVIYKKLYGFSLGEDFEPFHLILDTDNLNAEEVFQVLCEIIDSFLVKSNNNFQ